MQREPYLIVAKSEGNVLFGSIVRKLRKLNGLRVHSLAQSAEVTDSFITGIERGAQAPTLSTAKKILSFLVNNAGIQWVDSDFYDLLIKDPETNEEVAFVFKTHTRGQNHRPDEKIMNNGIWMAYYSDYSDFMIFPTELEALRHAVNNTMSVKFLTWGQGRHDL